ncbi:hypothetical protein Ddc_03838 [Ditylenchus destructor]|nr:hypothetical protein Ddc_03838 [Ditylenchus destructor]
MEILNLYSVIESLEANFYHRNPVYRWYMHYFLDVCQLDPRAVAYNIPQPKHYTDSTVKSYAVINPEDLSIEIPLDAKFYDLFCKANLRAKFGNEKFGREECQTIDGKPKNLELSDPDNAKTLMSRLLIDFSTSCYSFCKKETPKDKIVLPLFLPVRIHENGQTPVKIAFDRNSLVQLLKAGQITHSSSSCRLCGSIQQESRDGICSRHSK